MDKFQKIGVTAFIKNGEKVLIVKRPQDASFLPDYFELPGGHVEFGETPEEALIREVKEEVSLDIEPQKPYSTFSYISSNGNKHTIDIQYIVNVINDNQEPKLSEEHESFAWITENEINNFKFSDLMKEAVLKGFKAMK